MVSGIYAAFSNIVAELCSWLRGFSSVQKGADEIGGRGQGKTQLRYLSEHGIVHYQREKMPPQSIPKIRVLLNCVCCT